MNPEGLFETMRWDRGKILLMDLHFERLFNSLKILRVELPEDFSISVLTSAIHKKCEERSMTDHVRVRLTVMTGNEDLNYEINSGPFNISSEYEKHLTLDIYPFATKKCNEYSKLKSIPFTPYAEAAEYAKENNLDDCILLNDRGRVADSSISNVFIIKDNLLFTPPLSEGCVEGVMRKFLLSQFPFWGYQCKESSLSIDDIMNGDEIFLTNSLRIIRSVKKFREKTYTTSLTEQIVHKLREAL